jgi:hypothetical protein
VDNSYAICLTHGEDVDGIILAALLNARLKGNVNFRFVPQSKRLDMFKALLEDKSLNLKAGYRNIYVGDLSITKPLIEGDDSLIIRLASTVQSITWIDHHEGTEDHAQKLKDMGIYLVFSKTGKCASGILYDALGMDDEYFFWLTELAQYNDYEPESPNEYTEIGKMLQIIVSMANSRLDPGQTKWELLNLVKMLANDREWRDEQRLLYGYGDTLAEYHFRAGPAKLLLKESEKILRIGNFTFLIAFGESFLPHLDTARELRYQNRGQVDGAIVVFSKPANNVLFFKDHESDFDSLPFCKEMGGGGREGDGGFSLGYDLAIENYEKTILYITKKLSEFISKQANKQ